MKTKKMKKKKKKKKKKRKKTTKKKELRQDDEGPTKQGVGLWVPEELAQEMPEETWKAASAYEATRGMVKSARVGEERYGALGDAYEEEQDVKELARLGQAVLDEDDEVDLEEEDKARVAKRVKVEVPDIVARLSVKGVLEAVPEQRTDEELAALMGLAVELLQLDFNAHVQRQLDEPAPTPHEQRERGEALEQAVRAYSIVAQRVGRFVVEMVRREPSKWVLKPVGKGLAGGVKFIVGKLLVKVPLAAGKAAQLFNGDQLLLHKAGGCELRALNALMEHNVPGVHAPLDVAVEVCGLEAHVMALLPIDGVESLKVGSADAGETLQCAGDGVAADAARKMAVALHLKPHRVCEGSTGEVKVMHLAGDVEVHESAEDGRAYVLDVGRLLPPTSPFVDDVPLPLVHQFRPELMAQLAVEMPDGQVVHALSPDGFCGWGRLDFEEHHAELRAVWQVVLQRSVDVARRLVLGADNEEELAALLRKTGGKRALAQAFHAEGVNMRTLLVARAGLSAGKDVIGRQVLLLECAFRAVKHTARRRLLQVAMVEIEAVHAVMSALEEELESEVNWRGEMCLVVKQLFVSHVQEVPETVREQFEADKGALADDLAEVLALVRCESSLLGQAFVASVREGVAGVRKGEDGRWKAGASVTQVRLPAYGDVAAAVRRLEVEIEARKLTKGEQSMEVLRLQSDMIEVLLNFVEKDPTTTRAQAEVVIAEIERSAGEDHERAFAIKKAAKFLEQAGEYCKALELHERTLRIYEAALGPEHPGVGDTLNSIGAMYVAQGKNRKALELHDCALRIQSAALGPEHPSVGDTLNNMGIAYEAQGESSKALELYERALRIKQATLDPEHPSVGEALNNIGVVYQQQGESSKALELFDRALRIYDEALDPEHPSVGKTLGNMGVVYNAQGESSKALELFDRALRIYEASLGSEHLSVGDTLNNMGVAYEAQDKSSKALELYERSLDIKEAALGPEHLSVGGTLGNMAGVYEAQGEYSKALELYERALHVKQTALGPEHQSVGGTLNNMARVYCAEGEYSKALELFERTLSIEEAALGPEHQSVGDTLSNMAAVYKHQGEYSKALELYERTLHVKQTALGPEHQSVGDTLSNMAAVYDSQGEYSKARC